RTVDWQPPTQASPKPDDPGAASSAPSPAELGNADPQTVPRSTYHVAGEVARGGLGRILRAYDRRLGRWVALKELLHGSGDSTLRFLREALITAHLQHPSIVPVYEAGYWTGGSPFYAMRMVSGRSLQDVIDQTHTLEERLALLPNLISVAEAIAYAHSE